MKVKLYMCGGEIPISEHPLGLGYLKSNCSLAGIDIEIVKKREELTDCDLIGLSSNAWGVREAVEILNGTKTPVVIGGQGTLWKKLINYPFKHIVIGEGEKAFYGILRNVYKDKVVKESLIKDIDILKFPERGVCSEQIPILTSRGCPFSCTFCSSKTFWEEVRFHSAEYFIEEAEYIKNKYPKSTLLYIMDDLFIAHKKRLEKIYELWMKKNLYKRFRLRGFIRSGLLDMNTAKIMKSMGFNTVRFGAESGSNKVLKFLGKETTVENHVKTIEVARKVGLNVSASFMYDIPGEVEEDRKMTQNFINKYKGILGVEGYYKFKAFPGTKFYNNEDLVSCDMRVRQ